MVVLKKEISLQDSEQVDEETLLLANKLQTLIIKTCRDFPGVTVPIYATAVSGLARANIVARCATKKML